MQALPEQILPIKIKALFSKKKKKGEAEVLTNI